MAKVDCIYWGENRADEFYFDVGCVIGYNFCNPKKCPDYCPIKKKKQ